MNFIDLWKIYGDSDKKLQQGNWFIKTNRLTAKQISRDQLMAAMNGNYWAFYGLKAEFPYKGLYRKDKYRDNYTCIMSDTPMERNTCREFLDKAFGNVLIAGLGLGLIVFPALTEERITKITILEIDQDVINLVKPFIQTHDERKIVEIIHADVRTYTPTQTYDSVWLDIWDDICLDNRQEAIELSRKYRKHMPRKKEERWISYWAKDELNRLKREEYNQSTRFL